MSEQLPVKEETNKSVKNEETTAAKNKEVTTAKNDENPSIKNKKPEIKNNENESSVNQYSKFQDHEIQQNQKFTNRIILLISSISVFSGLFYFSKRIKPLILEWCTASRDNSEIYCSISYILLTLMMTVSMLSTTYFTLNIIKMLLRKYLPERILLPTIIERFSLQLSLLIVLVVLNCLVPYELYFNLSSIGSSTTPVIDYYLFSIPVWITTDKKYSPLFYLNLIPVMFKIIGIVLIRDLTIYLLNFNIHYKYYEKRIQENSDKINVLKAMSDITNTTFSDNVDLFSSLFIKIVSNNGPVTIATLENYFKKDLAYKIFKYCNKNEENIEISEEEVKEFYISTLLEQKSIIKSIEHHNITVESFKSILNAMIVPACIYQLLLLVNFINFEESEVLKNAYFLGSLVFSMNYIFSESLKSFVNSLSFIFFVRPYEIDDLIILNDKLYIVTGINLLTTVLYDGSTHMIASNSKLSYEYITNLRLSRVWGVNYTSTLKLSEFESKHDSILLAINSYIKTKTTEFKKSAQFTKMTPKDNDMVEVTLLVKFNSDVSTIDALNDRRSKFFFKLEEIYKGAGVIKA